MFVKTGVMHYGTQATVNNHHHHQHLLLLLSSFDLGLESPEIGEICVVCVYCVERLLMFCRRVTFALYVRDSRSLVAPSFRLPSHERPLYQTSLRPSYGPGGCLRKPPDLTTIYPSVVDE